MFTGLVEEVGVLRSVRRGAHSSVLSIGAREILDDLKVGDSVAVNGVCLTAHSGRLRRLHRRRDARDPEPLLPVRPHGGRQGQSGAGPAGDALSQSRLGGHIVSGHIDGTGTITARRRDDNAVWYTVAASPSLLRYIVEKGSIAMDGISLTVAGVTERDFSVSVIPHTAAVTSSGRQGAGDVVNLETDIIGKYVEKLLRPRDAEAAPERGLTLEFLAQNGF